MIYTITEIARLECPLYDSPNSISPNNNLALTAAGDGRMNKKKKKA